ncbi:PAS domain S-box protein [uncultured Mucilaginibacter sp.]|uniref:PAS domain-containing protein n=1 Tax=uncultured Mucilaginibacter sp. TaxID=797541 RepID=UPI0025F3FD90|nr:PAS domain S-box protein [uncultured Mucilaginibacter sp.]
MKLGAIRIAIIYIVLGIIWIAVSDRLLSVFQDDFSPAAYHFINLVKGILYVLITGVLLWKLIKNDDQRLTESEKQYREIYAGNPLPMWIYDIETFKFVSVNKAAVLNYGYSAQEFLNMTIFDIRPPEERDKVLQSVKKVSKEIRHSGTWIHKKANGELIYVNITSQQVTFSGKMHVIVIAQDVNKHVLYEQHLSRLNAELLNKQGKLTETQLIAKVAGWEYYLKEKQMVWSDELFVLTERTPLPNQNLWETYLNLIHAEDRDKLSQAIEKLIDTGEEINITFRITPVDNKICYVRQQAKLEFLNGEAHKITGTMQDITEYKVLEIERNKYQFNLEDTLNSMSESFFALDAELKFVKVNAKFEEETGFTSAEVAGRYLLDVFHEDKEESACKQFKDVLANKQSRRFEDYVESLKKWLFFSVYPTEDGLAVYFQDITTQKKKDIQLKQALERYHIVLKATNDVIYDYDMVHNNIIYNTSLTHLIKCDLRKINYDLHWWRSLIHPDDLPSVVSSQNKVLKNKETNWWCEYRIDCGNGEYKYVYDQGYFVYNDGAPVRLIGAVKDIDELKRSNEENKRLADIITKVNNMVIVMDADNRIGWVNKAFEDYANLPVEKLLNNNADDVLNALGVSRDTITMINDRKAKLESFFVEIAHYLPGAGNQWLEIEYTPLFDHTQKHKGYIAVQQNITSRKEKEERVSKQNKILQEIAWLSSHEVRRPVASILGLAYLAKDALSKEERDEIINMINQCAGELDSIVHVISARVNEDADLTSAAGASSGGGETNSLK